MPLRDHRKLQEWGSTLVSHGPAEQLVPHCVPHPTRWRTRPALCADSDLVPFDAALTMCRPRRPRRPTPPPLRAVRPVFRLTRLPRCRKLASRRPFSSSPSSPRRWSPWPLHTRSTRDTSRCLRWPQLSTQASKTPRLRLSPREVHRPLPPAPPAARRNSQVTRCLPHQLQRSRG